jgi:exopolyphosphatase/guanosine-5'-triphosphate,3'-diphosphate pyrophosphatase
VRRARRDCGLDVEIVPEDEEARLGERALVVAGAGDDALSIDVGGGSTEVACRALALRRSIPIGAVVLTESFLDPERPDPARFAALRTAVEDAVAALPADAAVGRAAWAIGGTAVHVASLDSGLARFDPGAVEGRSVDVRRAGVWAERLSVLDPAGRRALPIEPERADILPAGLAVLGAVAARLGASTVRVSAFGLRHALADELLTAAAE